MATAQETLDLLASGSALLTTASDKMDQVIIKIQNLNQGGGATQVELDQIFQEANTLVNAAMVVDQKIDQALAL